MENNQFQDLVLEHLARLTQEITELKIGQEELRVGQDGLRAGQDELRIGQDQLRTGQDELRIGQDQLRVGLNELRVGQDQLRAGQDELNIRQDRLESKVEMIYSFTARLAEDLSVTNQKLDALTEDVRYLKYKGAQNEEDLFKMKSYLKMSK